MYDRTSTSYIKGEVKGGKKSYFPAGSVYLLTRNLLWAFLPILLPPMIEGGVATISRLTETTLSPESQYS